MRYEITRKVYYTRPDFYEIKPKYPIASLINASDFGAPRNENGEIYDKVYVDFNPYDVIRTDVKHVYRFEQDFHFYNSKTGETLSKRYYKGGLGLGRSHIFDDGRVWLEFVDYRIGSYECVPIPGFPMEEGPTPMTREFAMEHDREYRGINEWYIDYARLDADFPPTRKEKREERKNTTKKGFFANLFRK